MIKEQIILGIDPGTTIMGYGLLKVTGNKAELIAMGVLDLKKYLFYQIIFLLHLKHVYLIYLG